MNEVDYSGTPVGLTDADVRGAMLRAIRLLAVLAVIGAGLFWWRAGWGSAVLLVVGAAISGSSLFEWLRLMTAMNAQMDAGRTVRPMGTVVFWFALRLVLTGVVLYGSLKYLHGTVLALAGGFGLGLLSLSIEAMKLVREPKK